MKRERLTQGPWQVTHGSRWRETHGMGSIEFCSTCHPSGYCERCHHTQLPHPVSFGRNHGSAALEREAACGTCHDREALCDGCHGLEMPHPAGFLPVHTELAAGYDDPVCMQCHVQRDCENCHVKHTHPGNTGGSLGVKEVGR